VDTGEQLGGLHRRAHYLEQYIKSNPGRNLIIVDSGDLLNEDAVIPASVVPSARLKAETIVDIYRIIGIHAVNVGDLDLVLGISYLKELAQKTDFPFISSNLVDANGAAIFPRYVIRNIGGKNVGIFGLISDTGDIPNRVREITNGEATVADVVATATAMVEELRGKNVDYIIALTHQQVNRDFVVARRVAGIDVIVGGHEIHKAEDPIIVDDRSLILRPGEKGMYIGMLAVDLGAGNTWTHELVPIVESMPYIAAIKAKMDDYDERVYALFSGGTTSGVNPAANASLIADRCGMCHSNQLRQWRTTGHAKAYDSLFNRQRNFDPSCLSCHTVLFEQPGGFTMTDQDMSLAHVQCESCHGNSREHMGNPAKPVPTPKPAIESCATCHTPDRNPTLIQDAKAYMDKIRH
jgi:hypothetical protein